MAMSLLIISISMFIRAVLLTKYENFQWIFESVFVSTPTNSWKRIQEGIYLKNQGISPYSGNILHEPPLLLLFFDFITKNIPDLLPLVFLVSEFITAICLTKVVSRYLKKRMIAEEVENSTSQDFEKLRIKQIDIDSISLATTAIYLLSPFSIICCGAKSTGVILNATISLSFYFMTKGRGLPMCLALSFATYLSIYPANLVIPCLVYLSQNYTTRFKTNLAFYLCFYLASLTTLFLVSHYTTGSWEFLSATYGFTLNVEELTPNIGLFWYFFTEMFDHFRTFFIFTFQLNAFVYTIPLTICFKRDIILVIFTLLGLTAIFKSYPNVGDVALYMALLPLWAHLYQFTRHIFLIGCFFLTCSAIGPVLYAMWIYYGSANANFFFGTTLAFNAAQVFLVTDILYAYIKREFHMKHGLKLIVDGETAKLYLK